MRWIEFKDELIKEIFPLGESEVLIEKAKRKIGERKYRWLLGRVGPARLGKSAEVAEKGYYLFKISNVEKRMEVTEDILNLPTTWQLEEVKKTRQFRRSSLLLAYLLAVVFFSIGFIPDKTWWLKIVLVLSSFFPVRVLNHKIFSILEKID